MLSRILPALRESKIFVKDLFESQKIAKQSKKVANTAKETLIKISDEFTPEEYNHIIGYDPVLAFEQSNWNLIDAATKRHGIPFTVEKTPEENAIMNFGVNTMHVDFWHMAPEEMNGRVKLMIDNPYKVLSNK